MLIEINSIPLPFFQLNKNNTTFRFRFLILMQIMWNYFTKCFNGVTHVYFCRPSTTSARSWHSPTWAPSATRKNLSAFSAQVSPVDGIRSTRCIATCRSWSTSAPSTIAFLTLPAKTCWNSCKVTMFTGSEILIEKVK